MVFPGPNDGLATFPSLTAPILAGFDAQIQQELKNLTPALFTDIYTVEDHRLPPHIQRTLDRQGQRARELLLRGIHFGNNITLLFRACSHCRSSWRLPHFWPAVASAFKCDPDVVASLADNFVRARRSSLGNHDGPRPPDTGATKAVDVWIHFIDDQAASFQPNEDSPRLFSRLDRYLNKSKTNQFLQSDTAGVVEWGWSCRPPQTAHKRQRSPSPDRTDQKPVAKRRPTSGSNFDVWDRASPANGASTFPPKPPLVKTDFRPLGQAAQANQPYQTPISASDGKRHDDDFPHQSPSNLKDGLTVRGCAKLANGNLKRHDSSPEEEPSSAANLEAALLQDKVMTLEKECQSLKEQLAATAAPHKENKGSYKKLGPATQDSSTPDFQPMVESFRAQLAEAEKRRVQDVEYTRGLIRGLERKLSASTTGEPALNQQQAIQRLESRIDSLETKIDNMRASAELRSGDALVEALQTSTSTVEMGIRDGVKGAVDASPDRGQIHDEVLVKLAHAEARITLLERKEDYGEALRECQSKMATLEHQQTSISKPTDTGAPTNEELVEALTRPLKDRITLLETQQGELEKRAATKTFVEVNSKRVNERLGLLDRLLEADKECNAATKHLIETATGETSTRLTALEKHQVESAKPVVTKAFVEKHLASLERQIEADKFETAKDRAEITKGFGDRIAALEFQSTQLFKGIEMAKTTYVPQTPKSSLPQYVQHDPEDMRKELRSLPGPTSVSQKVVQIEKTMRIILEEYKRDTNERMGAFAVQVDTAKAQIQGFNKLLNKTTSDMIKCDAVEVLEGKLVHLSRDMGIVKQSQAHAMELENKVEGVAQELTLLKDKARQALGGVTPAGLPNKLQQVHAMIEDLNKNMLFVRSRVDTLSRGFRGFIAEVAEGITSETIDQE